MATRNKKKTVFRKILDIGILTLFLVLTAAAGLMIPRLRIESSVKVFLPESSDAVRLNDELEDIFGSQDLIFMTVETKFGSVLDPDVLAVISELTEKAENLPHVDEVISLTNADYIMSSAEGMTVVDLYQPQSGEYDAATVMKRRLVDWQDVYKGTLVSEDLKMASVIVRIEKGENGKWNRPVYNDLKKVAAGYGGS